MYNDFLPSEQKFVLNEFKHNFVFYGKKLIFQNFLTKKNVFLIIIIKMNYIQKVKIFYTS